MKRRQSESFKMAKAAHKYLDFLDVLLTAKVQQLMLLHNYVGDLF